MGEFEPGDEWIVMNQIRQVKVWIAEDQLAVERLDRKAREVGERIERFQTSLGELNRQLAELLNKKRTG